ncbi:MAG: type II secretion system protein [Candidatus Hinthialibacter sp.]
MTRKAFTLIELLIVVAIIGILAAVAVPNFINARMRALVSRTMADVRALASAVDMYRIDNNGPPFRQPGWPCGLCPEEELNSTYNMSPLTTPVAYMTHLPYDPFIDVPGAQLGDNRGDGLLVGWYLYVARKEGLEKDGYHGSWWIWGWGPDKTRQGYPIRPYDASNGIISSGDIIASEKQGFLREDLSIRSGQANENLEVHTLPNQ